MIPGIKKELDDLFAQWDRSDAPGLSVGVAHGGRIAYRRGLGMASLEAGTAITPATRMRIGSTTKHMAALLALLLAEEGRLDLDAPIRTYVHGMDGPGGDPSIRQLLGHRGGSRCYLDLGFMAHGVATPPPGRAVELQRRQRARNFPVGEAVIYNNGGYQLVSTAIEHAGGQPLADQFRDRLFEPLGMTDTCLVESDHVIVPRMATLHVPLADGGWRRGLFPTEELRGDGGVVSTVDDMLRWTAHLRARDRFGAPESWRALVEPVALPDGALSIYALGMMAEEYRGRHTNHHAGGVIGGASQMLTFPDDDLDIVVLSNGAPGADPTALAERVADIVLADRLGAPRETVPADGHADLVGHWWSPETSMVYSVAEVEGALRLGMSGGPPQPLRPTAGGSAIMRAGAYSDIEVLLHLDGSGRLPIAFGGHLVAHERLPGADAGGEFISQAAGTYASEDADCVARVEPTGEHGRIFLSDAFGSSEMELEPLGPNVALARRSVGQLPFSVALLQSGSGDMVMSTARTRHLAFSRR